MAADESVLRHLLRQKTPLLHGNSSHPKTANADSGMIRQGAEMSIVITLAKVIRLTKDRCLKAKEFPVRQQGIALYAKPEDLGSTARGHQRIEKSIVNALARGVTGNNLGVIS